VELPKLFFEVIEYGRSIAPQMANKVAEDKYESVKIKKEIVNLVRENKKKNFIPISIFFENAAMDKLKKQKSK
jgi:hypothetical protein